MKVLLLEDDNSIRMPLAANLREAGHEVIEADRVAVAEPIALVQSFDVFLFDVGLPEGKDAGFGLVQRLRSKGVQTPVLFLTARDAPEDRARAYGAGADDYLLKPFLLSEVQTRLKALVTRAPDSAHGVMVCGDLRLDFFNKTVYLNGNPVRLSNKEYATLELLASNPGRVFSHLELIQRIYDDAQIVPAVVDLNVMNIRRKLAAWTLETVDQVGFRFPSCGAMAGD